MPLFTHKDRDAVGAGSFVFALLAALLAFAALVTAAQAKSEAGSAPAAGVQVALSEFAITPSSVSAPAGGTLVVVNNGSIAHNLSIEGTDRKTKDLQPGESATLGLKGLDPGTYNLSCAIAGHKEAGMTGVLTVGGAADAATSHAAGHEGGTPEQLRATDDATNTKMEDVVKEYVKQLDAGPNTKGVGNQPLAPKVLPDGTKEFELTASIIDWEVEPGSTVSAWAYNEQVPGPWIKVEVGDHVRVVLHNKLPQSTAIHFHGIQTPFAMDGVPDITQQEVKPDETFTYDFVAKGPALGMYHSHHHAEHQVPDGLVGVFQVGEMALPPGTGPVSQEVPMVLNDAGAIGLTLNAKSFPATAPIIAKVGDWVEISYFNEGLQIHPMHLHGLPQLVIAKDGFALPQPYLADTVLVSPGERYTVLVHATADFLGPDDDSGNPTPGIWAFHCHILTHAERADGMFGMVTTFIVTPA